MVTRLEIHIKSSPLGCTSSILESKDLGMRFTGCWMKALAHNFATDVDDDCANVRIGRSAALGLPRETEAKRHKICVPTF
jgi:hypothetical protein